MDVQAAHRLKIPHTFVIHTYTKPTKCHFCNKMLVGVFKQVDSDISLLVCSHSRQ